MLLNRKTLSQSLLSSDCTLRKIKLRPETSDAVTMVKKPGGFKHVHKLEPSSFVFPNMTVILVGDVNAVEHGEQGIRVIVVATPPSHHVGPSQHENWWTDI